MNGLTHSDFAPTFASVLVVDDDPDALLVLTGLLTALGAERVCPAGSAEEALSVLQRESFSAILCDYRLAAGELGTDVVQRLRACLNQDVPALIVSADGTALPAEALNAADMHLLRKPLKPANLRAVLHHVLSINRAMA